MMADENGLKQFEMPMVCSECGERMTYRGIGEYVCEKCGTVAYDDYGKVRNYIESHPGATQGEVSRETGVSQAKIRQMLIDEKLEVAPNSAVFLHCALCNADIRSGKYCEACARKVRESEIAAQKVIRKKMAGYGKQGEDAKGRRRFQR